MRAPVNETARSRRNVQHLDKAFFAGCAIAGGMAIAFVDVAEGSKWTAVGICVALMLAYAGAAFWVPGLKLRPDQAADNLYYLGLLYTLTSLGVALIRFTSSEQATDAILRNFGIAIFTTIVGLGLRVFVAQFREDPEDVEQEARVALSETVRRMRQELDLSVAELRSFADGMRQVVGEFTERANTSTVEALEGAVAQFERSASAMGERFATSSDQFGARISAFDGSLERVVSSLEGLMDRIGAVRADADVLERGLRPALDAVERAVGGFAESVSREQSKFEAGAEGLGKVGAAAQGLGEAGVAVSAAAAELQSAGGKLGDVARLVHQLEAAASAASDASQRFDERLRAVADNADARNAESLATLHQAASDAANAAQSEAQARLVALESTARRVIESLNGLEKEFAGSGDAVIKVRRELAELAGWIIARLEK